MISQTVSSIQGCIVALNMNLEILALFLQLDRIVSIYSRKPISNILSASSMTKCSREVNENFSVS